MKRVTVDVQLACDDTGIPDQPTMQSWVADAVAGSGRAPDAAAEVVVRVVDADEIRALNVRYRQKHMPTNVLSFPAGAIEGMPGGEHSALGDLVVCASVVRAEADEQDKALADHWAHLLVHGTLHLLGFDHEADDDALAMESLETEILGRRGVGDPYAGR